MRPAGAQVAGGQPLRRTACHGVLRPVDMTELSGRFDPNDVEDAAEQMEEVARWLFDGSMGSDGSIWLLRHGRSYWSLSDSRDWSDLGDFADDDAAEVVWRREQGVPSFDDVDEISVEDLGENDPPEGFSFDEKAGVYMRKA